MNQKYAITREHYHFILLLEVEADKICHSMQRNAPTAKLKQESWINASLLSFRLQYLNPHGANNLVFRTVYHLHFFWTDCTATSMTKSSTTKQTVVKVWKPSFSCSIKLKALPVICFINRPNLYNIQFSVNGLKTVTPQVRSINIQSMGSSVLKMIITFIGSLMDTV